MTGRSSGRGTGRGTGRGGARRSGSITGSGRGTGRGRSGRRRRVQPADGSAVKFAVPPLDTLDLAASMDRVAKILARSVGDVARKYDATVGQLYVVAALCRAPKGLTAKEMASALAIRPGSLTGMLDTLQDKGVLRRERVVGDGRQQRLVLLDGARELVAALHEVDAAVSASLQGLQESSLGELRMLSERTEEALRSRTSLPMPDSLSADDDGADADDPDGADETTEALAADDGPDDLEAAPQDESPAGSPEEGDAQEAVAQTAPAQAGETPTYPDPPPQPRRSVAEPTERYNPREAEDDPSLRRGLLKIGTRVLTAVDAQLRRRRDD